MRVCHIIEAAGGGSGQVVIDLARYGLAQGDDVTIAYAVDRADSKFSALLKTLPGIKLLTIPMRRTVGIHDIGSAWAIFRTLRKAGPFDIIHAHSSKAGALARLVGWALPGTVFYTPHAFYSMNPVSSLIYGIVESVLSWLTPCIIAVSAEEMRHAEKIGIARSKLFLIPNGTTPHFTASRQESRHNLGIGESKVLFGSIGRLEPQKNPLRLVESFARIASLHPEAHLVMVGDGRLRSVIEAKCAQLDIEKHISLLGFRDARGVIPGLDCLVCSSEFEGAPITFVESLAAGVPIISTPVGGTEEAIIEGETGFVTQDFSQQSLFQAMDRYMKCSQKERQRMSRCALEHSKAFGAEIMSEKYRALYQSFISR